MAFFSDGQNRVKLYLLYIIKVFRVPVSREQVFTAFSAADGTDFFTVCSLLDELEQEQFIVSVPVREQQLLYPTEKGIRLVDTFAHEIARSTRDELNGYIEEKREAVRNENCITADTRPQPDGSWRLFLTIIEKDSAVFGLELRLPDAATTERARRAWLKNADEIYLDTLKRLTE